MKSAKQYDASGIILYYDDSTTASEVEVCFRDVATPTSVTCHTETVDDDAGKKTIPPAPLTLGNYFVTIENVSETGNFMFDAVQVLETGLTEGIFDAATLAAAAEVDLSGGAALVGANIEIENGEFIDITVDSTTIGFSFILENAGTTSSSYQISIFADGGQLYVRCRLPC